MKNKDNRNENGFNKKLYIIGAAVIVLICIIATALEVKYKGTESALINADSVRNTLSTTPKNITPTTTIPTEKSTETKNKPTDAPTKPTKKATKQKAQKAKKTTTPPTEQPTAENKTEEKAEEKTELSTTKPDTEIVNNNVTNSNNEPSSTIVIEKPTQLHIQLPQYTEQDIIISQSVVYLKVGDTANVDVIFPAGLSSAGVSWNIDNSMVATFSSANFNTTTLIGKNPGTTTVYAYPKGYSVALQCTVIVSQ